MGDALMGVIRTSYGRIVAYRVNGRDWWFHPNVPDIAKRIEALREVDAEGFRYGKRRFRAELALPPDTVDAGKLARHILHALAFPAPEARTETVVEETPPFDCGAYAQNPRFPGQAVLVDGYSRVVGYLFGEQEFGLTRLNLGCAANLWNLARQRGMDSGHTAFEAQCLADEVGLDLDELGCWAPLDMAWGLWWHSDWRARQAGFTRGTVRRSASTVPLPKRGRSLEARIRDVRRSTVAYIDRAQAAVRTATVHARVADRTAARLQECDVACGDLAGALVDAVRSAGLSYREAQSAADSEFECVRKAESTLRFVRVSSAVRDAEQPAMAAEASAIAAEQYVAEALRARRGFAQRAAALIAV
jgi:hypothetical protein